jgi:hypothetical protein
MNLLRRYNAWAGVAQCGRASAKLRRDFPAGRRGSLSDAPGDDEA